MPLFGGGGIVTVILFRTAHFLEWKKKTKLLFYAWKLVFSMTFNCSSAPRGITKLTVYSWSPHAIILYACLSSYEWPNEHLMCLFRWWIVWKQFTADTFWASVGGNWLCVQEILYFIQIVQKCAQDNFLPPQERFDHRSVKLCLTLQSLRPLDFFLSDTHVVVRYGFLTVTSKFLYENRGDTKTIQKLLQFW